MEIEYDDPVPGDDNDPVYRNQMFLTYEEMKTEPEELIDPKMQQAYRKWLQARRKKRSAPKPATSS